MSEESQTMLAEMITDITMFRNIERRSGYVWLGCAAGQASLWVWPSGDYTLFSIIFPVVMVSGSLALALNRYLGVRKMTRALAHLKALRSLLAAPVSLIAFEHHIDQLQAELKRL